MKKGDFERLPLASRRRLLEWTVAAFGGSLAIRGLVPELSELLVPSGYAQNSVGLEPTYFIEINLRDQFDFSHIFTPPGIARAANLIKGENGNKVCYFESAENVRMFPLGNGVFLTQDIGDARTAYRLDRVRRFV